MKVFKYELKVVDPNAQGRIRVDMPSSAQILSTAFIGNELFVWALVNPGSPAEPRYLRVVPTGHPTPNEEAENLAFIGTVLLALDPVHEGFFTTPGGSLVFHVFEDAEL